MNLTEMLLGYMADLIIFFVFLNICSPPKFNPILTLVIMIAMRVVFFFVIMPFLSIFYIKAPYALITGIFMSWLFFEGRLKDHIANVFLFWMSCVLSEFIVIIIFSFINGGEAIMQAAATSRIALSITNYFIIEEGTKIISAMTEFNKYADEKIAVLDSIYEKTDDNELKKACVSVKQYVNAAKNKNMSDFKSKLDIHTEVTLNEIVDWEINSFTDIIVDEMIKGVEGISSAAGAVLTGAKIGKDVGLLVGNQLFDADNMTTAMLTLDTLCKIDDTLKSVLNDTEAKYKSDMTYENAVKLTSAADLSKTLQMYSCDVTKDLVNSVKKNEQNMYKYAPILPYNSILTITKRAMGKMPDYDYLEQTLDKLKGQFEAMDLYIGGIDIAEYIYSDKSTESSDWSKPYIERALRYGILPDYLRLGYKRGLTRAEFCTYIVNLLEAKSGKNIYDLITEEGQLITSPFDDCTYYYVDCVYKLGIISGMSDNEFKPLGNLTREQAAKILYETAKILGIDTSAPASDLTDVSEWAKDGVNFVVDRNIMTGTDNGFEPQSGYSKEQALTSLVRFYENLK